MSEKYTVSSYLIDRLQEVGVEHVFGVPGDYGFPFMDQIEDAEGITWVGACNELNATYAADGYARTRGLAAVTGSCGVLEMGGAGGIAGAWDEQVPILVIAGFPSAEQVARGAPVHHSLRGRFDRFAEVLAPITVSQTRLTAEGACAQIDQAISECWAAKAPVYLQFPSDVQQAPATPPAAALTLPEPQSDPQQLARFLEVAVSKLRGAQRPAILADYPIARYGLTDAVQQLSESAGIPLATTLSARGSTLDQTRPGYLGFYAVMSADSAPSTGQQRVDASDVLVRVCPRQLDTNHGLADPSLTDDRLIDLQTDSATVGGTTYPNVAARDVLTRLHAELGHGGADVVHENIDEPTAFSARPGVPLTQDALWAAFTGFAESGDVIAVDYGTVGYASMIALPVPTRGLFQASWEAIGWTTPAVVGAQLADPNGRHLHVVGDGGFQETAQEISTLIRHGLAPITILVNNGTYQVENITHVNPPVDKAYNRLHGWNYAQLPAVLAGDANPLAIRVRTEDELVAALDAAAAAHREGRYSFIEAVVAADDVAIAFAGFIGGPAIDHREAATETR